jgi:hypothetical protein
MNPTSPGPSFHWAYGAHGCVSGLGGTGLRGVVLGPLHGLPTGRYRERSSQHLGCVVHRDRCPSSGNNRRHNHGDGAGQGRMDTQISTAKQYPRSITRAREDSAYRHPSFPVHSGSGMALSSVTDFWRAWNHHRAFAAHEPAAATQQFAGLFFDERLRMLTVIRTVGVRTAVLLVPVASRH